ncbi:MAG: Lrp/AsnC ligand binding domain-containing protein [Nitrospira sp.]|nr:Lrp/AsnC ligand binding domain-containing protein [Nitrospira sp.]
MQIHRAYVLINVLPGLIDEVIDRLSEIDEIKTIDSCWGKPDIIALTETSDQEALTQLVLTRIHAIDGVAQTDTHLVYQIFRNRLTHA